MSLSRTLAIQILSKKVTVSTVIELLTKYKMLPLLPSVKQAVVQISSQPNTRDSIMIETPFPLTDASIQRIKRIVGNDIVEHHVVINKNVLAGFKARFKGILYDGSAERIIKQFTEK